MWGRRTGASPRAGNATATIAAGPLAAPLFRGEPALQALHVVEKRKSDAHWFELWRALRGQRFDLAIDLRGTLLTLTLSAKKRIIYRKHPDIRHKTRVYAQKSENVLE